MVYSGCPNGHTDRKPDEYTGQKQFKICQTQDSNQKSKSHKSFESTGRACEIYGGQSTGQRTDVHVRAFLDSTRVALRNRNPVEQVGRTSQECDQPTMMSPSSVYCYPMRGNCVKCCWIRICDRNNGSCGTDDAQVWK